MFHRANPSVHTIRWLPSARTGALRQAHTTDAANGLGRCSLAIVVAPCSRDSRDTFPDIINGRGVLPAVATVLRVGCAARAQAGGLGFVEDLDDC
jgi:hypothetical protein